MSLKDWSQDRQLASLEQEANSTVDAMGSMSQQIFTERKRNDVQTARIKALAEVVEAMLMNLGQTNALPQQQAEALLQVLRTAMAPVKL